MENEAIIVGLGAGTATVEVAKSDGCGHCHEPGGCGSSKLAQMRSGKPQRFVIPNTIGAKLGDKVLVMVPDGMVLQAVARVYAIPLLCLVLGVGLGTWLGGDLAAIVGGAAGLVLGYFLLRRHALTRAQTQISMRVWEARSMCANRQA